jgi:hypothetical protein
MIVGVTNITVTLRGLGGFTAENFRAGNPNGTVLEPDHIFNQSANHGLAVHTALVVTWRCEFQQGLR